MTPCPASAATRPATGPVLALRKSGPGRMISATPMARRSAWPDSAVQLTRAVDPVPNHSCAGLSRVNACSATSASMLPNGRPMAAVAPW